MSLNRIWPARFRPPRTWIARIRMIIEVGGKMALTGKDQKMAHSDIDLKALTSGSSWPQWVIMAPNLQHLLEVAPSSEEMNYSNHSGQSP